MTWRTAAVLSLALLGCPGEAPGPDGGTEVDAGLPDAGPPAIVYTQFTRRADGLPTGARLSGAAVLDGVLYASTSAGLFALPPTETRWESRALSLPAGAEPTSLQRVDQALVLTAGGAATGGLYRRTIDDDWAPVSGAPTVPCWALVKKSTEWLLATSAGLYAAPAVTGPWALRGTATTAPFTARVAHLVAAPAQQKIFAAAQGGGLYESANLGATWAASAPRGAVNALAASGAFVWVDVATDGQQRSDNYGNTFRPAPAMVSGLLSWTVQGTTLWATTQGGLSRSDDDGATWQPANDGLPSGTPVLRLFFAGGYVVADTSDGPFVNQVD